MKIQCSCGAKYAIDVTPGMQPVKFICPSCSQDYSAFVNEMIQRELGEPFPAAPVAPVPAPAASAAPPSPPVPSSSRLRISGSTPAATPATPSAPGEMTCPKHHEPATEQCFVCKKPICPKCMEIFGYFCSPFCKSKGEHLNAPVYAGQTFVVEARHWRKVGSIVTAVVVLLALAIGVWTWYAWFASVPHPYFSVRFEDKSYSGTSLAGDGQIVFLHGGTLARYDLKTKKPVWSLELVTTQQIDDEMKREDKEEDEARKDRMPGEYSFAVSPVTHRKNVKMRLEGDYSLHGSGQNIWVTRADTGVLTHYDWNTGSVVKQVMLTNGFGEFKERGNELVMLDRKDDGGEVITHIDMAGGDVRTEDIHGFNPPAVAENSTRPGGPATGGLPLSPNNAGKPLDPRKVAAQAQNLTPGARAALPALVANAMHQQQIQNELRDTDPNNPRKNSPAIRPPSGTADDYTLVPDADSYVGFSVEMIEARMVEHAAMKAAPAKSVLDDPNLNGTKTTDAANELLNEMQRNAGGDKITEDQSRYRVAIRRPESTTADWSGEVVGPPQLLPQKTVNVVAAGKSVVVLDKSGKKLWQADLTFPVSGGGGDEDAPLSYGKGPCVEHGDTLYVCDQAVLTAFDLSTGNVRWRLPSVGIVGLFFDDHDMIYVNTTTGSPDDVKYSRQIDVTKKTEVVLLKVDPKTGTILWSTKPRGFVVYLSGKFIYTFYAFDPGDEEDQANEATTGLMNPPFLCITRIDPKNGKVLWEHTENRAPLDTKFVDNTIRLIFRKEVEVLRYLTL